MRTETRLLRISGIPQGISTPDACTDIPDGDLERACRQALRIAILGYWIGGGGYHYRLKPADILAIETPDEVPAILTRRGNIVERRGQPALAVVDVICRPTGERRRLSLELAYYDC